MLYYIIALWNRFAAWFVGDKRQDDQPIVHFGHIEIVKQLQDAEIQSFERNDGKGFHECTLLSSCPDAKYNDLVYMPPVQLYPYHLYKVKENVQEEEKKDYEP